MNQKQKARTGLSHCIANDCTGCPYRMIGVSEICIRTLREDLERALLFRFGERRNHENQQTARD